MSLARHSFVSFHTALSVISNTRVRSSPILHLLRVDHRACREVTIEVFEANLLQAHAAKGLQSLFLIMWWGMHGGLDGLYAWSILQGNQVEFYLAADYHCH